MAAPQEKTILIINLIFCVGVRERESRARYGSPLGLSLTKHCLNPHTVTRADAKLEYTSKQFA